MSDIAKMLKVQGTSVSTRTDNVAFTGVDYTVVDQSGRVFMINITLMLVLISPKMAEILKDRMFCSDET